MVELLLALMVTALTLTAVSSLAFALGSANRMTDDLSRHQTALRYTTMRIPELVKHSIMAFSLPTNGICLWTGDDNSDGFINASELVYIETDETGQRLQLLEFPDQNQSTMIDNIKTGTAKPSLIAAAEERYITLLPQCDNVQFTLDASGKFVNILFDLTENGVRSTYQISATLRCSASHLLNESNEPSGGDDD